MALETKTEVQQFLTLQTKNELELRAICEGMELKTEGTKEQLIERLLSLGLSEQRPVVVAQAIPLRTRDNDSQPLQAAIEAMRHWRKLIFNAKGNIKEFQLLNSKGKQYKANLKYVRCSCETLRHIIEEQWYLPLEHNRDLIEQLKTKSDKFEASIVQKPDGQGKTWLMLHVQLKAA